MTTVTTETYPAAYQADLETALGYQLPHPLGPSQRAGVQRIAEAIMAIDVDVAALVEAVAGLDSPSEVDSKIAAAAAAAVAGLVDTAPATLDTLNELAAALGDDPNYAATTTAAIAAAQAAADAAQAAADGAVKIVEVAGAPDADDDDSDTGGNGTFAAGAEWRDTTNDVIYKCADASTGAAVWLAINVQGGLIGEVAAWPAAAIPSGWLECDGAAVSRTTYASLFAAIGTTFGVGDGSTTFNLPDLRGEFIRGLDNGRGVDAARALGSAQTGQVGDIQMQTPFGIDPDSNADLYFENPDVFGEGGAFTADRSIGASGSSTSADYALTSTPYRAADDESSYETRPRNVALKYIIRAASTYDVADLTPNMPAASEVAPGAIEIATQAEVDGGTETTKAVVPYTLAGWAAARQYSSTEQAITAGGQLALAHGLGIKPSLVSFRLKNTSAELGWSVGDEIFLSPGLQHTAANRGAEAHADASEIIVRFGNASQTFNVFKKDDGTVPAAITNSKWTLIVDAWVLS